MAATEVAPEPVRLRPRIEELVSIAVGASRDAVTVAVAADLTAVVDPSALDRMLSTSSSTRCDTGSRRSPSLAIVRGYACAHGGDIISEPAMPHGARFEVVLPARVEEAAASTN
jgi:sensor histidine kinase regulating citrate/malate metabolism